MGKQILLCFIRPPHKILDDCIYATTGNYTGTAAAVGRGIGDKEKSIAVTGDIGLETSHIYADMFIPVQIKRYSPEEMRKTVGQIDIGTDVEEVKQFLSDRGIRYSFFLDIDDNGKLSELDL